MAETPTVSVIRLPVPAFPAHAGTRRLRWLYVLVVLALVAAGAGAGVALYTAYDLGGYRSVASCLTGLMVEPRHIGPGNLDNVQATYETCAGDYNRGLGLTMAAAMVSALVLAWALMLGSGLVVRLRLRRAGETAVGGEKVRAVRKRFDDWCDELGLTGSRRPVLVLAKAGRGTSRPFTTALPWGRPRVVLPAGYAYLPEATVDFALLHELAHVQARDVTWATATWWTGWLNVPVLAVAMAPLVLRPESWQDFRTALVLAALLSAAVLVLRAAALRRRERAADHYAVARGGCLQALRVSAGTRSARRPWTRLLATHPDPAQRGSAALAAPRGWEGGFAVSAAAGLLAMFVVQCVLTAFGDLVGRAVSASVSMGLALTLGGLLWATALVPVWSRSIDGPARVVAAVAGSALGLLAGLLLAPPGTLVSVPEGQLGSWTAWLPAWTVAAVGVSCLGVRLATAVSGSGRRRMLATTAAVTGAAAALAALAVVSWTLWGNHVWFHDPAIERILLVGAGQYTWGAWTPVLLLAGTALMVVTVRHAGPWRQTVGLAAATAVVGASAAIVLTGLRINETVSDDDAAHLLRDRWWICAGAGWAVVVAARLARSSLPCALLAGGSVSVLAGAAQYGRDLLAGPSGHSLLNLLNFVRVPLWLTFVLTVVTLPVTELVTARAVARRLRPAVVAVSLSLLVAVPVATGVSAPLTGRPGDWTRLHTALSALDAAPAGPAISPPRAGADPGRLLTSAQATRVLDRVQHAFPPGWSPKPAPASAPDQGVRPAACAKRWRDDAAAAAARTVTAEAAVSVAGHGDVLPPHGATVDVALASAANPDVVTAMLDEMIGDTAVCPRWSVTSTLVDGHRLRLTQEPRPGSRLGQRSFTIHLNATGSINGRPMTMGVVQTRVLSGHNEVSVSATYPLPGQTAVTDDQWTLLDRLAADTMSATVAALSDGTP
ncbi:M48 family metalloprotease [Actinoplanes sp. N902-109]|uniref:M48 family metalloprotease n=1 Tax=Actinoplanes sp. (strain N902-109) TaxID=649831 RepID=UPI0012F972F2|nr:M48 family metalloprotease [Actinoplanes sp. N902-109]